MDTLLENSGPEPSPSTAQSVLRITQLLYPVILLLTFIISAGLHTIVTSRTEGELVIPTVKGPGGKPLPVTKRKREQEEQQAFDDENDGSHRSRSVFLCLTTAVILSFVANGVAIANHALQSLENSTENQWWCGEERVVSNCPAVSLKARP